MNLRKVWTPIASILLGLGLSAMSSTGLAETLFTSQTPAQTNLTDGPTTNYELGMKFKSTAAGYITGIRFYKASSETGTHTGKIYSNSQLLASVVFTNETASGWQEATLSSPLNITANTQYTVSVNTGNSYYVATNFGLQSQVSSSHLRSVVGSNGVFGPVGSRPTNSYQDSNYFRDVVFSTTITPPTSQFHVGDRIRTIRSTNVRASASLSGTLLGTQATGALGTLTAGPVAGDGYIWFTVDYDTGADGYSGDDNFELAPTTPPPSNSTIPLSFDDARYASNTTAASNYQTPAGGTLSNKTWDENNSGFSVGGGDFTLTNSRIRSNEAIRIWGSSGGAGALIDGVYAETTGTPGDHADTVQCYAPGASNNITIKNSMLKAHTSDATAGFFYADDFAGSVTFENMAFWGGPFGLRMHADGNIITLSLKDVYFIGPFGYDKFLIDANLGGTINIVKWENVREATIVNGAIVPGNLIPQPTP